MAFGIPGSEASSDSGEFLGRIQYDSRVGLWKIVKRAQGPDGRYYSAPGELFPAPLSFLFDGATLEVGYVKLDSAPVFQLVPYGQPIPPRPQEMKTNDQGKQVHAFMPGFRCKVMSPKTFGDDAAYYFCANAKTVLGPMDDLYQQYLAAQEAAQGLIPAIQVTGKRVVEAGQSKFYAPVWNIGSWHPRPAVFGERTVQAHGAQPATNSHASPSHHAPPPGHVPPPVAAAAHHAPAATPNPLSEEMPF